MVTTIPYPMDGHARQVAKRFLKGVDERIFTMSPEDLLTKFYTEMYQDILGEELKSFFWSDREIKYKAFNGVWDRLGVVIEEMAGTLDETNNVVGSIMNAVEDRGFGLSLKRDVHMILALKSLLTRIQGAVGMAKESGIIWKRNKAVPVFNDKEE